jgi:nitrite reductase (NAD(P)H)
LPFYRLQIEKLYLNPPAFYTSLPPSRLQYHLSLYVTSISPSTHTVLTSTGEHISYDYCVLATGSASSLPPYLEKEEVKTKETQTEGVFTYRNIGDLERILKYVDRAGKKDKKLKAVVVGGGLLGLEAAKAVFDLEG